VDHDVDYVGKMVDYDVDYVGKIMDYDVDYVGLMQNDGWNVYTKAWTIGGWWGIYVG
jgi:hypothetical protein